MKIRKDMVTNSSSSSYICVAKIDNKKELEDYMKEEFGKFGLRLLEDYLMPGFKVKESDECCWEEFREFCEDEKVEIDDNAMYLAATFIQWTSDGDTEGNDAFLYRHIPDDYKEEVYEG